MNEEGGTAVGAAGASARAEGSSTVVPVTFSLTEGWQSVWVGVVDSIDSGLLIAVAPAELIWSLFRAKPAWAPTACLLLGTGEDGTLPDDSVGGDGRTNFLFVKHNYGGTV